MARENKIIDGAEAWFSASCLASIGEGSGEDEGGAGGLSVFGILLLKRGDVLWLPSGPPREVDGDE